MGGITWFVRNRVAANLLMALVMAGGVLTMFSIKQEVFPEFALDLVTVTVPYRGAAPEEVEEGVCIRIEEAIDGLDGVKEVTSVASEGVGTVTVELDAGADSRQVLDDIKARVDAIDTFPEETEKPITREITNRRQVIMVSVSGDAGERTLRHLAEQVRDEISALPGITLVDLASARPYEISIEVSEEELRRHALTFDFVADAVRRSSLDLPGGSLRTSGGEILLRSKGQAYDAREFEDLVLVSRPDGTQLTLGEVAHVVDGFEETDQFARFDGKPAVTVEVYRTGDQSALGISSAVHEYVVDATKRMPPGVQVTAWQDAATILRDRLDLMIRNGRNGFILVFITLALFLRFRLAFWVSLGLLFAFLGALWVMPWMDLSVNLISLFAFILVLGIVVDDAIIVGENIFTHQHRTGDGVRGAVEGTCEVSLPVVFAVLTTVAAFVPLVLVSGTTGKIMRVIPLVVIPCLLWSLAESLFILPAHLSHYRPRDHDASLWRRAQSHVVDGLESFIKKIYVPTLTWALEWRYLTLATGAALLLLTVGLIGGGAVRFLFFPHVESDVISVAVTMPPGTPVEVTSAAVSHLEAAAAEVDAALRNETGMELFRDTVAAIGEQPFSRIQRQNAGGFVARETSSHLGEVTIEMISAQRRPVSADTIVERWRAAAGPIADAVEVRFSASIFQPGDDIDVRLTGPDLADLQAAAAELKARLATYTGVNEIADSFRQGKQEIRLALAPGAASLGLTLRDLARQVRQAFYGEEVQRIQRGRDDVRVMVRYPAGDRRSVGDLETMHIRTPAGVEVPFSEVARVRAGRGYASIKRVDRRRAINVTADVDDRLATPGAIIGAVEEDVLPGLLAAHSGVQATFEGQQAEQRETIAGLTDGFILALLMIYALLAIPLRSYGQPVIIMLAIPFGLVGAVWGHMLIGLDLTILSMFGLVALAGVVVNDALVMVDFINRHRATKAELETAVRAAGVARFRPILLTSLTTFAGLSPLMMERSMQARFLIPMAVSLAFGVLFSTAITLVLIPAGYLVMEDLRRLFSRILRRPRAPDSSRPATGRAPRTGAPV
ncbi:MAG: efflux RND transporter permease subunit [Acidobacteriota bacterium]